MAEGGLGDRSSRIHEAASYPPMAKQRSGRSGGSTPATTQLHEAGVAFTVHEYEHDPAVRNFGLEAAVATGADPGRVFKTLVAAIDGGLAVGIVPVERQLSMKALAAAAGSKRAELADQAMAERITGYVRGGISPFGQKRRLPTSIDATALSWPTIFVSGGRRGLEIEVAPADLVAVLSAVVVDLAV